MIRPLAVGLGLAILALSASAQGPEACGGDTSLVVALRLKSRTLSEGFPALLDDDHRLFLPLCALSELLGLEAAFDEASQNVTGSLPSLGGAFTIDVPRGLAITRTGAQSISSATVRIVDADAYVEAGLLERWLNARITFSFSRLEISIFGRSSFPVEQRWDREIRRGTLAEAGPNLSEGEVRTAPYRLASPPYVDVTIGSAGLASDAKRNDLLQGIQVSGAGDLLFMESSWFFAGDWENPFRSSRLQLSRFDPDGRLLGGLRATTVALGDVWLPSSALLTRTALGRGFMLSNFPSGQTSESHRTSIAGTAMPGWEVELYRDDALLAFQTASESGEYRFDDVPLLIGRNGFRIVAIGPGGQIREETRTMTIGEGMAPPGQTRYRIAAASRSEFGGSHEATDGGSRGGRWIAEFETGLSDSESIAVRFAGVPIAGVDRKLSALGIRKSLGGAFGTLDLLRDDRDGWGVAAGFQTRIRSANLSFTAGRYGGGFVSEQVGRKLKPLAYDVRLRVDGDLTPLLATPISASLSLEHEADVEGRHDTMLAARFSANIAGAVVANAFRWNGRRPGEDTSPGVFSVRRRVGQASYRAELGYALGSPRFESVGLTADWAQGRDSRLQLGIRRELGSLQRSVAFASFNRTAMDFVLGLNVQVDDRGGWSGGLVLTLGLGVDPATGRLAARGGGVGTSGLVQARAFHDHNGNGRFDEGDEPIVGARFLAGKRKLSGVTDASGVALLTGLTPGQKIEIRIDANSLEDPTLACLSDPVRVSPRAGIPTELDFPMARLGEIAGVVAVKRSEESAPLGGIRIQLLNERGGTIATTRTAFDGVYFFGELRPGNYRVRPDPEQVRKLGLGEAAERAVHVKPAESGEVGVDFELRPKEPNLEGGVGGGVTPEME